MGVEVVMVCIVEEFNDFFLLVVKWRGLFLIDVMVWIVVMCFLLKYVCEFVG